MGKKKRKKKQERGKKMREKRKRRKKVRERKKTWCVVILCQRPNQCTTWPVTVVGKFDYISTRHRSGIKHVLAEPLGVTS